MDAETNTGQADEMSPKPIDLQNDFEQSQNAFESLLAGPQEDTQTESEDEALQDSDDEALEAVEEDFDDDDQADEMELSADDDDDDVELDEEPDTELSLVDVTIDGEIVQVTQDELVKGYSRQSDYTRKTQALSEERKAFEEERQAVRQERDVYEQMLGRLEQQLQTSITPEEQQQLDHLRQTDPVQYVLAKEELDARQERAEAIRAEQDRLKAQREEDEKKALEAHVAKEREALLVAVPEWKDQSTFKKERDQIEQYALSVGFTPEELAQLYDSRAMVVFRDAMRAGRASKAKPTQKVKPVAKAGAKKVRRSKRDVAMKRLQQSGSNADATAVFETLLSGKG